MNLEDISKQYQVPIEKLTLLKQAGFFCTCCQVEGDHDISCQDLEKLSQLLTMVNLGFSMENIKTYLRYEEEGTQTVQQRMQLLKCQRAKILTKVHQLQTSLDQLDYLLYELKQEQ